MLPGLLSEEWHISSPPRFVPYATASKTWRHLDTCHQCCRGRIQGGCDVRSVTSKDGALDPAGAKLTNAFRVGSMSEGLSVTAPVAVEAHQDVDDMLEDMCRELEADEQTSVRESVPRNAVKRKSEGVHGCLLV